MALARRGRAHQAAMARRPALRIEDLFEFPPRGPSPPATAQPRQWKKVSWRSTLPPSTESATRSSFLPGRAAFRALDSRCFSRDVPGMSPSPGAKFRAALAAEKPLQIAGAINAYAALLAQRAGFRALYLSGAGVANHS